MKVLLKFLLLFISFHCFGQTQIVSVNRDNKVEGKYYFNQGIVVKAVFFGLNDKDILTFKYSNKGEIVSINLIGSGHIIGFDEDFQKQVLKDAIFQKKLLKQYDILFPLPYVNNQEVKEMATFFSIGVKHTTNINNKEKTILFDSIYKKISFRTSIEQYIPHLTIIKQYKVNLKEGFPIKEKITFDGGVLERSYYYDKIKRLTSIVWNCKYDNDPKKYIEVKKILYN